MRVTTREHITSTATLNRRIRGHPSASHQLHWTRWTHPLSVHAQTANTQQRQQQGLTLNTTHSIHHSVKTWEVSVKTMASPHGHKNAMLWTTSKQVGSPIQWNTPKRHHAVTCKDKPCLGNHCWPGRLSHGEARLQPLCQIAASVTYTGHTGHTLCACTHCAQVTLTQQRQQ